MSDAFLSKLLQYRSLLVDREFIKNILKEIDRFQSIRQLIISICSLLGLLSFLSVVSLDWMRNFDIAASNILEAFAELPTESIAMVVMSSILILGFWLVVDD